MNNTQQLPPQTCPYANKAGLVIMTLGHTGKVQAKTNATLYEVYLAQENGKFKKLGRAMSLTEAGTAAAENERALGWDKLPARVLEIRGVDPAVMKAKSKRAKSSEKIEAGETIVTSMVETEAAAPEPVVETVAEPVVVAAPEAAAVARPEGAKPERAQPKASERQPRKPDPIVEAARAASRNRFK